MTQNNCCNICGGDFRITRGNYEFQSRFNDGKKTVIEDAEFEECIVCGKKDLTERYYTYIELLRDKVKKEYVDRAKTVKDRPVSTSDKIAEVLKSVFK